MLSKNISNIRINSSFSLSNVISLIYLVETRSFYHLFPVRYHQLFLKEKQNLGGHLKISTHILVRAI